MTPIETIEADIRAAIERARAEGWRIVDGIFVARTISVCDPLGAVCLADGAGNLDRGAGVIEHLKGKWGVSRRWIDEFVSGFDHLEQHRTPSDPSAYALGRRLREEFVDG